MQKISPIILRVGIGAVIIWFGLQQLGNPSPWIGFLPLWTKSLPISQLSFVYLNGWFELISGILLIAGFFTQLVAGLLTLHLLGIVCSVGYSATGVRDLGITIALLSIFLHGTNSWSLDEFFQNNLLGRE